MQKSAWTSLEELVIPLKLLSNGNSDFKKYVHFQMDNNNLNLAPKLLLKKNKTKLSPKIFIKPSGNTKADIDKTLK